MVEFRTAPSSGVPLQQAGPKRQLERNRKGLPSAAQAVTPGAKQGIGPLPPQWRLHGQAVASGGTFRLVRADHRDLVAPRNASAAGPESLQRRIPIVIVNQDPQEGQSSERTQRSQSELRRLRFMAARSVSRLNPTVSPSLPRSVSRHDQPPASSASPSRQPGKQKRRPRSAPPAALPISRPCG